MTIWVTDLRKIAFLAFISSVLSLLTPVWNTTQTIMAFESTHPQSKIWMIPTILLVCLITASMLMFYFALFRNDRTLHFPRRFGPLALVGVVSLGVYVVLGLPGVVRSLNVYWTGTKLFDGRSGATSVSTIAGEVSNLATILLLIVFFRQANDEPHAEVPISRLLDVATKVAVIAYGLWSAFNLVRLIVSPLIYSQLRDYALQVGREPPEFRSILAEVLPALLSSLGFLIAPYIVYKSRTKGGGEYPATNGSVESLNSEPLDGFDGR